MFKEARFIEMSTVPESDFGLFMERVIAGHIAGFSIRSVAAGSHTEALAKILEQSSLEDERRLQIDKRGNGIPFTRSANHGMPSEPIAAEDWRRAGYEPLHNDGIDPVMAGLSHNAERTLSFVWSKQGSMAIRVLRTLPGRRYLDTFGLQEKLALEQPMVDTDQFEQDVDQLSLGPRDFGVFDATRQHYSWNLTYPRDSESYFVRFKLKQ